MPLEHGAPLELGEDPLHRGLHDQHRVARRRMPTALRDAGQPPVPDQLVHAHKVQRGVCPDDAPADGAHDHPGQRNQRLHRHGHGAEGMRLVRVFWVPEVCAGVRVARRGEIVLLNKYGSW